jgi:gliding motility-associated-like protein
VVYYNYFGEQLTRLIVSNGFCTDTSYATVNLNNFLKAGFEGSRFICPNDPAIYVDTSIGNIRQWQWDFGNGITFNGATPTPQFFLVQPANYDVPIKLIVTDNIGCKDTASMVSTVVWNCYIAVPSAFTPNNDGLNDYLYPLNAYKALNLKFSVYNRLGERVYYTEDWTRKWNGYCKGKPADSGTYVWMLSYTDSDSGKKVFTKGSTVLIR